MKSLLTYLAVFVLFSMAFSVHGQIKLDVKKKISNQANNRANQRTDQGIDKGLDVLEKGVIDAVKKDKTEQADEDQEEESDDQDNEENTDAGDPAMKQEPEKLQSYSKYDFIPGEKVIFYDDFSQDAIGDFPALWNTNGSAEVVTTNLFPGNWMKFDCRESIWTDELLNLPENYTIEFDVIPIGNSENKMAGYQVRLLQSINAKAFDHGSAPGKAGFLFNVEYFGRPSYSTHLNSDGCRERALSGHKEEDAFKEKENQKYHIAIWVQKSRIRLYQNQDKLFDLPRAMPVECIKVDRLRFEYGAAMVSNVRMAVGAPDMRSKLITEGKLVSYGIYFDVNKDQVKPESYGTLKEIAAVLNENPDVRIKIVGYTDSDGADAANLDLSKRRGASVKNELTKNFGIEASRLESDGIGEGQPVAANDTPANKALNRRVEFIKL